MHDIYNELNQTHPLCQRTKEIIKTGCNRTARFCLVTWCSLRKATLFSYAQYVYSNCRIQVFAITKHSTIMFFFLSFLKSLKNMVKVHQGIRVTICFLYSFSFLSGVKNGRVLVQKWEIKIRHNYLNNTHAWCKISWKKIVGISGHVVQA